MASSYTAASVLPMAPAPMEAQMQRPSMRRKSSAQNLLSSFKSNNTVQQSYPPTTVSSTTGLPFVQSQQQVSVFPNSRDWDVQSQTETLASTTPILGSNGATAPQPQGNLVEMLREVVKKRVITLTYLRNVHEGRSHWFHTIMITRNELDRIFNNNEMKSRTYRFATLGMSLAHSFDVKEPTDLLRGLQNALNEYDQSKEEGDKPKMRGLFKSGRSKRQMGAPDYALSYSDTSDTSFLVLPQAPFSLDYHQTLLSLLDVLSEVYNKISKILGPSPIPSSGQHMMGPLGLLSPHPGVSYLFTGAEAAPTNDSESSLWGIAHATAMAGSNYGGGLGSPPPSWNSALGDAIRQIDGRLKKLVATLLKELDDCARKGIRDELTSLDPLLRNVAVPEDGQNFHDFE